MPLQEGDEEVKEGKTKNKKKKINSEQIVYLTSNIISTNKSWKQSLQTKK